MSSSLHDLSASVVDMNGLVQIGIDLPAFVAGVIGLGLHFAVYNSELIQTAILALDRGQMEAARSLGMSYLEAMRYIILPQAVRRTPSQPFMPLRMVSTSPLSTPSGCRSWCCSSSPSSR